jgi:hypothetical protein
MDLKFESLHSSKELVIALINTPDFEDIFRAHIQAIAFTFTALQINDWDNHARRLFAV